MLEDQTAMFVCTRREVFLSVFFLFLTLIVFMMTFHRDIIHEGYRKYAPQLAQLSPIITPESCVGEQKLIQDRIRISRMLNSMKHNYSIMNCEMLQLRKKSGEDVNIRVSESGGWCRSASDPKAKVHKHDRQLSEEMMKLFKGKAVGSFGDGPGEYNKFFDSTGKLKLYDAYDGAPDCKEVSGGVVEFMDLTAPQYGLPLYDWVMSLEVAEHVPRKYESIYVDNIVRHAKEGIVLSWARPKQHGLSNVNNRPLDYVKKMLYKKGFFHDPESSSQLMKSAHFRWLRANTNVYRRFPSSPANPRDA